MQDTAKSHPPGSLQKHGVRHPACRLLAVVLLLIVIVQSAAAEVTEKLSYASYAVKWDPARPLLEAMNANSPCHEDGKIFQGCIQSSFYWEYRASVDAEGRCTITDVWTTLNAKIIMPELVTNDPQARQSFKQSLETLHRHELGHYQIALANARKIDKKMLSLFPENSCAWLEAAAQKLGVELLRQAEQEQRDYDATTRHGLLQDSWQQTGSGRRNDTRKR